LGFASLRIQLEDGEKVWKMRDCISMESCVRHPNEKEDGSWTLVGSDGCRCLTFQHPLPGHQSCLVELQTPNERHGALNHGNTAISPSRARGRPTTTEDNNLSRFQILGEVLAEGWAKSLADWHKQNQSPIRFQAQVTSDK
jgi:hypothetical protein